MAKTKRTPNIDHRSPGDYIRDLLTEVGWTQEELARILSRPIPTINEIVAGKKAITPEMALALGEAFGTGAELWTQREAAYRLALATLDNEPGAIRRRARLYQLVPVRELQKRGWVSDSDDLEALESEILSFLEVESLDDEPEIVAAARKTDSLADLGQSQRAWCFRVKQLARSLKVQPFRDKDLGACAEELRRLSAFPQESKKVAKVLSCYGIRFVVVEPLPGSKIDGAAMWLDPESPVIAVSVRYDRIDAFWFTLAHEFAHIVNGDALSIDSEMTGQRAVPSLAKSDIERRADNQAAALLVPPDELQSFIKRVGPQYSRERINQFANRIKIHPGIIVGQLQHRGELSYQALRPLLVKIREFVVSSSVTDGWGSTIEPGELT